MTTFLYRFLQILLLLLIFATVVHAFCQSSLPAAESVEQSDKIGEIIEEIIPPETKPGEYIQKNLRKLAHFTEFFFLGLWSALYAVIYTGKCWAYASLIPFGMTIALLDETVQIFSKRGSSVTDIWIDVLGYASSVIPIVIIYLLARLMRRHRSGRLSF